MSNSKSQIVFLLGFLILGCTDWDLERVGFTRVITIGVIEVGSNSAFLIGDIENIRESSIVETGFVLSSTSTDDASLRLDQSNVIPVQSPGLDTISEDRAFAARATALNGSTEYFFRAYVKIEGEEQVAYGNIDQFTTSELIVSLKSVNRTSTGCPSTVIVEVQVEGLAPGGSTEIGVVYSDDLNNVLPTVENGILLKGADPSTSGIFSIEFGVACERSYFMQVVLNPESANPQYSNPHAITMIEGGLWSKKSFFPGLIKKGKPVSFAYKSTGYMGGGDELVTDVNQSRLWQYEVSDDSWKAIGDFENLNLSEAVSVLLNDKVFIGGGLAPLIHCDKLGANGLGPDIDGNQLTWEGLCGNCGASRCIRCGRSTLAPEPGNTLILYQGYSCLCYNKSNLVYDPIDNSLELSSTILVGANSNALFFRINDEAFLFGGENISVLEGLGLDPPEVCQRFIRQCGLSTIKLFKESSELKDPFLGQARIDMAGFALGDFGYTGLGAECVQQVIEDENGGSVSDVIPNEELLRLKSFYSFDPSAPPGSQWQEVESYPGNGDNVLAFSSDNKGYVVFKMNDGVRILWQFDPNADSDGEWSEIGVIPNPTNNNPYHLFTIGNVSYVYFPTSSNNFWMYIPELG